MSSSSPSVSSPLLTRRAQLQMEAARSERLLSLGAKSLDRLPDKGDRIRTKLRECQLALAELDLATQHPHQKAGAATVTDTSLSQPSDLHEGGGQAGSGEDRRGLKEEEQLGLLCATCGTRHRVSSADAYDACAKASTSPSEKQEKGATQREVELEIVHRHRADKVDLRTALAESLGTLLSTRELDRLVEQASLKQKKGDDTAGGAGHDGAEHLLMSYDESVAAERRLAQEERRQELERLRVMGDVQRRRGKEAATTS